MEPNKETSNIANDAKDIVKDVVEDVVDDVVDGVKTGGKSVFRFLKSIWFWVIATPINMAIAALVLAIGFPYIFLGWPDCPPELVDAEKAIVIDKDRQAAYGYEKGELKHRYVILTGRKEHDTPVGKFAVTRKIQDYRSREYDAPMPYSLFFIDSRGIAMHESFAVGPKWCIKELTGNIPNIGSHGCVRFTFLGSRHVFKWAEKGTPVWVTHLRGGETVES